MRPMAMLARSLDPTRLILDESGGWAYGANMYLPDEFEPTKFNDIHNYPGPFINKDRYDGYLSIGMTADEKQAAGYKSATPGRNVVPGLMSYVSELGYGSLPDLTVNNGLFQQKGNPLTPAYRYHQRLAKEQQQILQESGFAKLYPNMQQFYLDQQKIHGTANKRMIEAVRANPEVDGYCIHALVAGDWILGAGLLDLWRNPKSYAYEATKAANQPRIVSIRCEPRNIYAEKGAALSIIGINELERLGANMEVRIQDSNGKVVLQETHDINWRQGVTSLIQKQLDTKNWNGVYSIVVKVKDAQGELITENSYNIDIFPKEPKITTEVKVLTVDPNDQLTNFLKKKGFIVNSFQSSNDLSIPVLVADYGREELTDSLLFQSLIDFSKQGGTVIYLEDLKNTTNQDLLPFKAKVHPARGLWTCIPHLIHQHPIFEGLPSNTMMRDIYENVWATNTLRNISFGGDKPMQSIVGAIGFDWFSKAHKMHYSGPGDSWWGSDVAILPIGKGHCIVSQLRILDYLGQDPVADKILINMIHYATKMNKD